MSSADEGQPPLSEAEAEEYARQLRSAPAEQVVTNVLFSLLNAAQVKLGRRDARLLIDLTGLLHDHARDYLQGEFNQQLGQVLGQLRMAQVNAENDAARAAEDEPNDLDSVPTPPSGAAQQPPQQPAQRTSKLWVPGQ